MQDLHIRYTFHHQSSTVYILTLAISTVNPEQNSNSPPLAQQCAVPSEIASLSREIAPLFQTCDSAEQELEVPVRGAGDVLWDF